ncbi:CPBP family intramembrane glutamic endopeptidase [Microtetraspora sp. NBRC 13810]|uniref:CPBP family intramembrane glutamic endopeptidase n=1 Tax=Microtetraspora sp. NBRC 13810 TaxID=3030990 RepID=UPI002556305D|nr:CPBP family intramembrane glutamic endopeptidase [Microtetraspora sp. NBRC 13810]
MHTTTPPPTEPPAPAFTAAERDLTRRQLTVFALVLPALVLPSLAYAVSQGLDLNRLDQAPVSAQIAVFSGGFMPGVAGLAGWLAAGRGLRGFDWGLRRVRWPVIGLAWLIPVLGVIPAYVVAWLTGAARFDPGNLATSTGLPPVLGVLLGLVPGIVPYMLLSYGEQIGWSNLLAVRLSATRSVDATALIVGLAWGVSHFPLMLLVPGGIEEGVPAPYALLWFMVETVALAYPLVWLRLRTGSIWPVLVLHATLNASVYFVAGAMTAATDHSGWFVGEGGALTSVFIALAVLGTRPLWRNVTASSAAN